jgi:alanine dehydrogenase
VPLQQGIIKRENIWGEIGEIVAGFKKGRGSPEEITVFTSTGLAIQDAITANVAYKKALKQKMGQFAEIIV